MLINQLMILLILLFLSGFFSSAETALFSIGRAKARQFAKSSRRADQLINRMKQHPHKLLTTILIGNNVVNIGASSLATALMIQMVSSNAVGIAVGGMTFLILVFGEIIPKSVATRNNLMIARLVIYPIWWMSIAFYPIVKFLEFIPKLTGKIQRSPITEAELISFVEVVEEEGEIKEEERELIHNIFEFDDTAASEIMTPRGDMFVINAGAPVHPETVVKSGFTRIPVFDGEIDNVVGILNIKDLFMHMATSNEPPDVRQIMLKPYFIPENIKLDKLMRQFKRRKNHIAVIVDEHGGVAGLITLEDVLEEIVGEISDETDKDEVYIVKTKPNEWMILGKTEIEDVNDELNMKIPESQTYDTFSGYILDTIGRIPVEKETIHLGLFEVTVQTKRGNRIEKYMVRHQQPTP